MNRQVVQFKKQNVRISPLNIRKKMRLQRDSLLSLVSFNGRGTHKTHTRSKTHSQNSSKSSESFDEIGRSPIKMSDLVANDTSSSQTPRTPRTPQTSSDTPSKLIPTPKSLNFANRNVEPHKSKDHESSNAMHWELLRRVLCFVSPDHPDFFAVHVDSTKTWYRGYLFHSEREGGKPVPFTVKRIPTLGVPAKEWFSVQTCNRSLRDSVRVVTLEWLFAIPNQGLAEHRIIQLIDELRRLTDTKQRVKFMNQVNTVLGLPILARTSQGDIMPVGGNSPLIVVEQQVSVASLTKQSNLELEESSLEQWRPRDLEVNCVGYDTGTFMSQCGEIFLRIHLRHITPHGYPGARLSENFEHKFTRGLKCCFKHVLPASPDLVAKAGRVVIVCELIDRLTSRYIGVGIARLDSALQPGSLYRMFELCVTLYSYSGQCEKHGASLYKSLITGSATDMKISRTVKEIRLEVLTKLHTHHPINLLSTTVNDYLNYSETIFMDFEKLVILKRPSLLNYSANDPFLIRIENLEASAVSGQDVGIFWKTSATTKNVQIELLNGSTIVSTSRKNVQGIPITADTYHIPLFDVEDGTMVGYVNVHQTYAGRDQLHPPSTIEHILANSMKFNLNEIVELELSEIRIWAGPVITSLLSQILEQSNSHFMDRSQKLFRAFLSVLSLGLPLETRYLYDSYVPPRSLLTTPLAFILVQQYCMLLEKPSEDLEFAFRSHLLLGRLLDILGATENEFRSLTQAFMTLFSTKSASEELLVICLQHIDELYLENTSLEVASQIGSILTVASYVTSPKAVTQFYWLLVRVAMSDAYSISFAQQFSSLVITLTERFWEEVGNLDQPLEDIRAIIAMIKALSKNTVEAPAFLSLCIGLFITNEPSFRTLPIYPLFKPHKETIGSTESEQATAIVEICLVLYELTAPESLPSRGFLNQLEVPSDLVYQLCSCVNIMIDSVVPSEWVSLNCALLQCSLRCIDYAATVLKLISIPDTTVLPFSLNKEVWLHVFNTLLRLLSDSRINSGLVRMGFGTSPLQRVCVDQSLIMSGVNTLVHMWQELAIGNTYGGFQVQFYEEYYMWGFVLLLGFNCESKAMCDQISNILADLLDGQHKLYGTSRSEALKTLLLSLDFMFRHVAPVPSEDPDFIQIYAWPRFRSTVRLVEAICQHLSSDALGVYEEALGVLLQAHYVLLTYWSEPYSRRTVVALKEVLDFVKEYNTHYLFEIYFGYFVDDLRTLRESDHLLGLAYFEAAQMYAKMGDHKVVAECNSPRLPMQGSAERRKTLVEMSLQHLRKVRHWKLAEQVMEAESEWLEDSCEFEQRSTFVTKWLPSITDGLKHYTAPEHNWYLLKFQGDGFGILSDREFVWQASLETRLSDSLRVISEMFNKVICLPWDESLNYDTLGSHVKLLTLEKENGILVHSKPVRDQHVEITQFVTAGELPSTGFVEVIEKHIQILGPVECAIKDLQTKANELKQVCNPQCFKQLDLVLSGILNAGVNGGLSRYADLLSTNEELYNSFKDLKAVVDKALEIYGQNSGEELRGQYALLCERAKSWQSLNSVDFGFF